MNITLILPTITQPRYQKRITALSKQHNVKVFAFDRGLYKKNAIEHDDLTILGEMSNKNYYKRIFLYIKLIKSILRSKSKTDMFYFFSIDFALLGFLLLKKNRFIYEIGDFAYLSLPKVARNILTFLDRKIIKKSYRTILTSDGFKNYLMEKDSSLTKNIIIIPNRPARELLDIDRKTEPFSETEPLRFGFVGILRYPNTVFKIVRIIAEKFPKYEFIYYGDGGLTKDFITLSESYSNLKYKGQFKNPDDLEKIYNDFDIHLACYDIKGLNQQLAEPNKLYESIYFGNPLVATRKSFLGEKVKDLGIGYVLDDFTNESIINFIENINVGDLNRFKNNMLKIDKLELVDSDLELLEALKPVKKN